MQRGKQYLRPSSNRYRRTPKSKPYQSQSKRRELPYHSRKTLLSQGEAAFFAPLQQAVNGKYLIMSKVRLADVVSCSSRDWHSGYGGAISQKHLDFVLCEPRTMRFILAVELDDRTHDAEDRKRRDRFVNRVLAVVELPLLRIQARSYYPLYWLRHVLDQALRENSGSNTSPHSANRP